MEKWVAISGLILTLALGWAVRDSYDHEWERYQHTYYRLAAARAHNAAQTEWAQSRKIQVIELRPTLSGSVERCTTCHLAVDNPAFHDGPEPLRQHSALLKSHPPGKFGCVACHGGQGRAVTTLDAHGDGGARGHPLLQGEYLEAPCYNCHGARGLPPTTVAGVIRGRQLVNRSLCLGCHQINGVGGDEGPALSAVGSQRSWLWLYAHLIQPQGMTVGSTMPVFGFSRDQLQDITTYLLTLQGPQASMRYVAMQPGAERRAKQAEPLQGIRSTGARASRAAAITYDGRELFRGAGCIMCHSVGNVGGHVGPELTHIARKRTADEFKRLLRDPAQILPGGKMPQLYLSEPQVEALTSYLTTLR
jgi:mono/diheme cytochrome c family protein